MGSATGARVANLFTAVHPDVYRHLLHLPLLSYTLFVPKDSPVKASEQDGFPPIILIHGMGGGRGDLLPLECYLKWHGRRRIYRIGLNTSRTLDGMSRSLAQFTQRVLKANEASQVDMVAHSLGGIVARLAINDHALIADRVRTLITMGTPHQGTIPARFMDTRLIRALHPDSPTIQKLKRNGWPQGVRGVSIGSKNDLIIMPADSAFAEGAEQVDMSPFTHFSYLIDPRSWSLIRRILEE